MRRIPTAAGRPGISLYIHVYQANSRISLRTEMPTSPRRWPRTCWCICAVIPSRRSVRCLIIDPGRWPRYRGLGPLMRSGLAPAISGLAPKRLSQPCASQSAPRRRPLYADISGKVPRNSSAYRGRFGLDGKFCGPQYPKGSVKPKSSTKTCRRVARYVTRGIGMASGTCETGKEQEKGTRVRSGGRSGAATRGEHGSASQAQPVHLSNAHLAVN